mmetsp:Transcript_21487/g.29718  ORF Transcript_21487/g.29718 Transcript_21487/m.29718 type:complete len:110 (+) Transcript_21487:240-569(+)
MTKSSSKVNNGLRNAFTERKLNGNLSKLTRSIREVSNVNATSKFDMNDEQYRLFTTLPRGPPIGKIDIVSSRNDESQILRKSPPRDTEYKISDSKLNKPLTFPLIIDLT